MKEVVLSDVASAVLNRIKLQNQFAWSGNANSRSSINYEGTSIRNIKIQLKRKLCIFRVRSKDGEVNLGRNGMLRVIVRSEWSGKKSYSSEDEKENINSII